jgi:hypothetical protein
MKKLTNKIRSKSSTHKEIFNNKSVKETFLQPKTLPYNFAEELLNLEMELEQDSLDI